VSKIYEVLTVDNSVNINVYGVSSKVDGSDPML
jgi:hypothetical protein